MAQSLHQIFRWEWLGPFPFFFIQESLALQAWRSLTLNGVFPPDFQDKFWDDKNYLKKERKKRKGERPPPHVT